MHDGDDGWELFAPCKKNDKNASSDLKRNQRMVVFSFRPREVMEYVNM